MILDEECAAIAETVRARAWERLAPHAAEIDRTQAFSKPVWEELRSMGIFGLPFAPEAGGAGASTLAYIVALEQVAYSCAVAALYPGTTVQVAQALLAAQRIGLVNHVVAHVNLLPATLEIAATIASRDAAVLRELKRLYQVSKAVTLGEALAHELRERDRRRSSGQALTPR